VTAVVRRPLPAGARRLQGDSSPNGDSSPPN
jgi:hypothetical protein